MKTSTSRRKHSLPGRNALVVALVLALGTFIFVDGIAVGGTQGQDKTTTGTLTGSTGDNSTTTGATTPLQTVLTTGTSGNVVGPTGVTTGTPQAPAGSTGFGAVNSPGSSSLNQIGNPNGAAPVGNPTYTMSPNQTQISLTPPSQIAEIMSKHNFKGAKGLDLFGYSFFEPYRYGIEARRLILNSGAYLNQVNPTVTPIGPPVGITNIYNPAPERYQLGPGDKLQVYYHSPTLDPVTSDIQVDDMGRIFVPGTNNRIVARGQTLAQMEHTLQTEMRKGLKEVQVSLQLKELRTISVLITGSVYAPGTYQMPATMSLLNALITAGGPNEFGSLRRISVSRQNGSVREFDLYNLFVEHQKRDDFPLQPGDVIYIPPATGRVAIEGEVPIPAVFELKPGETLKDIVHFAGGIKPTGVAQAISVETTSPPGGDRRLINADLFSKNEADNPILRDGDAVQIYSVRPDIINQVTIDGEVDQPHRYAFYKGMHVSDLIGEARGLTFRAYPNVADLFRKNPDQVTQTLIKIDLQKALAHDPKADILLKEDDLLKVYAYTDVQWMGERKMQVQGSVNKPGTLNRTDNMTVRDAILQAGGLGPDAYDLLAFVQRNNPDGTVGPLFKVNLRKANLGNPADNVLLQDRDVLTVLSVKQSQYVADQSVSIAGAVQQPAVYKLGYQMTVRDLILESGNLLPTANLSAAFIQRTNLDGTPGPLITFDVSKALAGDPSNNPELESKDSVQIYTQDQAQFHPRDVVEVVGAVQLPASYVLSQGMKVHDVLALAGNPLPTADMDRAYLLHNNSDGTVGTMDIIDLVKAQQGDPKNDVSLRPNDKLSIYTKDQSHFNPEQSITIKGAVQNPGVFPRAENMTMLDLIHLAGGPTPKHGINVEVARARAPEGTPVQRYLLDDMMGPKGLDVKVDDGEIVTIAEDGTILDSPMTITVTGEVKNPGPYLVTSKNFRLTELLHRAGGLLPDAYARGAQFTRKTTSLQTEVQTGLSPKILQVLQEIQADDYKRALARSDIDKLSAVASAARAGLPSVSLAPSGSTGGVAPTAGGIPNIPGQTPADEHPATTPARQLSARDLEPTGSVNVDVNKALRKPGGLNDVKLQDGDTIYVPPTPISVNVVGAVMVPASVMFVPGKSLMYYVTNSGGFTTDAAKDQIVIIRASGNLLKVSMNAKLELGDTVFIPTRVQADHLHEASADFTNALAQVTNAGLLIAVVNALVK